jgi:hypothetical protein
VSQLSQVIEALDHFFQKSPSSTESWMVKKDCECPELLKLWHVNHLILVYDMKSKEPLWKWWEKDHQKQGLDEALTYLSRKIK